MGFNFNRYGRNGEGDQRPDPREHITVRLDVEDTRILQEVEARLDDMKNRGEISDWCREENNPYDVTPFEQYSPDHHVAHEASTACALKFNEEMRSNPDEFRKFSANKVGFLSDFLPHSLRCCGFRILTNLPTPASQFIDNLASICAEAFRNTVRGRVIENRYVFTERFVHTFLNCICVGGNEEFHVVFNLMRVVTFENLSASLES